MPILEFEIVGDAPADVAQRLADAAGEVFGLEPGRVWVKLRRIAPDDYAENGGSTSVEPVFVKVLHADVPVAIASEVERLTAVISNVLARPSENVHLFYEPSGGGRVAFGGDVVTLERTRHQSGAPWEDLVGYSRMVRDRGHVYVTGTAPVADDGSTFAAGKPYEQALRCLELIERALAELPLDRSSIVRTRMFVTDIDLWEEFGRAHREFFGSSRPATTMVEVRRLIRADMLIEIEADATV